MSEPSDETQRPQEDETVAPDLTGVGPRDDDETVTAEDLVELQDEPKPVEPSG